MLTKNNIIILSFIIFIVCLYFLLSRIFINDNSLTKPVNNTNQSQNPSQKQQDKTEYIYIDC